MFAIVGAGAIGCYVGGCLAAAGAEVTLIGRARVLDPIAAAGLRVTDLDGRDARVRIATATEPAVARAAQAVIVTAKSAATAGIAATLAQLGVRGPVISLQNGVRNAGVLARALPAARVIPAMVPFNVIARAPDHYHRASAGTLAIAPGADDFVAACRATGLAIDVRADLGAVQWAKLVLNLNNAINALADLPLAAELAQRDYRVVLAAAQREALALLRRAGQPVARLTAIPPRAMPRLLALPDPVFARVARRVIAIDPSARSSMHDDLAAGRPTEIDYINGEIVALADRLDPAGARVNRALVRLVRAAERTRRAYTGAELRAAVGA